jgi:hypothetical protein
MTTNDFEVAQLETTLAPTTLNDSLAVEQQREAGINALARMSEFEFEERMKALRVGLERFDRMMGDLLTTGSHHGADLMTVEGIDKPILTLSGAEKTCFVARLVPTFAVERTTGAPPSSPAIHYLVRCDLHLGNTDGPVVAQGVGSCSSHERKYRWRTAEKSCPECGVLGTIIRSKFPARAGTPFAGTKPFYCWKKKGGCGIEFSETDERITRQVLGMVENPDPYDLDNTLLKMAKKRAFVDATKTATASSGRVTVDLEENAGGSDAANDLRDEVFKRARATGWKTLGPILEIATKATGRPCRTKIDFDRLSANDLARVLERMPAPAYATESADAADDIPAGGSDE